MSADEELQLIAKIADTGNLRAVLDAGVTLEKFAEHDA
jgi:hypothetical protein